MAAKGLYRYLRLTYFFTAKAIKGMLTYRWSFLANCISQALDYSVTFDALVVSVLLQRPVAKLRPCRPPFLGLGLLVPVGGGDGLAFVLPLFRVIDFLALRVKNVLLFLLRSPRAALLDGARCQHDMGVGVPPSFCAERHKTPSARPHIPHSCGI